MPCSRFRGNDWYEAIKSFLDITKVYAALVCKLGRSCGLFVWCSSRQNEVTETTLSLISLVDLGITKYGIAAHKNTQGEALHSFCIDCIQNIHNTGVTDSDQLVCTASISIVQMR